MQFDRVACYRAMLQRRRQSVRQRLLGDVRKLIRYQTSSSPELAGDYNDRIADRISALATLDS